MYLHVAWNLQPRARVPEFSRLTSPFLRFPFFSSENSKHAPGNANLPIGAEWTDPLERASLSSAFPAFYSARLLFCTAFLRPLFGKRHEDNRVKRLCALDVRPVQYFWRGSLPRETSQSPTAFLFPRSRARRRNIGMPWRLPRYAHFHSVAYYYGLYPLFKTGYSNRLDKIAWWRTSAEEIWRWNSA